MHIERLYLDYLKLRGTDDPKRLNLKADIAIEISEGRGEWYLQRLQKRAYGIDKNYGELASKLSDGKETFVDIDKREPSLAEAVLATRELNNDYQTVENLLLPKVISIIKIGSAGWGENYDVRRNPEDLSDLDTEVIIDDEINPEIGKELPGAVEGLKLFGKYYKEGKADYFSYGFKIENRPVSIHFMPKSVFKRNCAIDCENLSEEIRSFEFRIKPKSKPPFYDKRHDGQGKEYMYKAVPNFQEDGSIITEIPVMMIGDNNQIVMGLLMDKYFQLPKVNGDVQFFQEGIKKFKTSLAKRLIKEGGGKFSNMPARKNRMPYTLLNILDKEQEDLLKNKVGLEETW